MPVAHTQRRVIGLRAFVKGVTHFASMIKWYNFDFNKLSSNDLS